MSERYCGRYTFCEWCGEAHMSVAGLMPKRDFEDCTCEQHVAPSTIYATEGNE